MLLWSIVLVIISGCASLQKDAGYEIETKKADSGGVEVPWHSIALRGDVSTVSGYTVAMIELPKPLPEAWKNEILDVGRSYKVGTATTALRRSVWRTALYGSDGKPQVFDAVLNPSQTALFVLLPPGRVEEFKRGSLLVWFSDGKTIATTRGAVVEVTGNVLELSNQFFATNPSPFPRYATFQRTEPEGRTFLESLEKRFPVRLQMSDGGVFSAQREIVDVGALTKGDHVLDNLVTCGSASATPSVTGTLVGAVLSLPHNLSVAANGCRKKGTAVKSEATQPELPHPSSSSTSRSTP
ncbi:MAG: hypothetical protein WA082_02385 [Candidatus Moraniibacteriota bacterium]